MVSYKYLEFFNIYIKVSHVRIPNYDVFLSQVFSYLLKQCRHKQYYAAFYPSLHCFPSNVYELPEYKGLWERICAFI